MITNTISNANCLKEIDINFVLSIEDSMTNFLFVNCVIFSLPLIKQFEEFSFLRVLESFKAD